jgi:hypothetical protein
VVQKVVLIVEEGTLPQVLQRRMAQFVEQVLEVLITAAVCGARLSDLFWS